MQSIIFVPGILGSELLLNEEKVWPPSLLEVLTGYQRLESLMDPNVTAGNPISNVLVVDFYGSLQGDLEKIAHSLGAQFVPFGYDWRRSIAESARDLGKAIDSQLTAGSEKIVLVAHSMGGLVCRYLLESGEFEQEPWFGRIKRLVGLAVPNLGSPLALVRALGLKGSVGLSGSDIIEISTDGRYPSLYQLVPPPDQSILWRVGGLDIEPLNHFDRSIIGELELSEANMAHSQQTWAQLGFARKPESVDYTFMGGTGHSTVTRVELRRRNSKIVEGRDAGDGTVPLWSSIRGQYQNAVAPGSHENFFRNDPARALLFNLFGVFKPQRPFSAGEERKPAIDISTQSTTYAPGDEIDIIALPLVATSKIEGVARLERRDHTREPSEFEPFGTGVSVLYQGPEVSLVRLQMRAPEEQGAYRLRFEGSHALSDDCEVGFFVTPDSD